MLCHSYVIFEEFLVLCFVRGDRMSGAKRNSSQNICLDRIGDVFYSLTSLFGARPLRRSCKNAFICFQRGRGFERAGFNEELRVEVTQKSVISKTCPQQVSLCCHRWFVDLQFSP